MFEKKSLYVLTLIFILTMLASLALAQSVSPTRPTLEPVVNVPLRSDVSQPLRDMPPVAGTNISLHSPLKPKGGHFVAPNGAASASAIAQLSGPLVSATIGLNFDALDQSANLLAGPDALSCDNLTHQTVAPPDTNMAVGDTQIVEWVNLCYAVFDKASGALVAGPFAGNQFWQGFGGLCEKSNDGDPIIEWDKLAHRWVAFQNVFSAPYGTCIAVSKTADATGAYYRYSYPQAFFPDYPKVGIMPDAFYQTQNMFNTIGSLTYFYGVGMCAYDRPNLLAGNTKSQQICFVNSAYGQLFDDSLLPADLDSPAHAPASGQPEVFLGSVDNACSSSAVYEYLMYANFKSPKKSKIVGVNGAMPISVPRFSICNELNQGISTPTSTPLDSLGDRLMYRLAYSTDGTRQNWVVTHSIDNPSCTTNPAGCGTAVRWYQFTAPDGSTALALTQAGQTPDDGESRWMGSAAMDKAGDIAIGYSRSSGASADYPSIYYSGHAVADPAGLTDQEALIVAGTGGPTTVSRWGDYSSMSVDTDGCNIFYSSEYLPSSTVDPTGGWSWRTRIASLRFPGCH